MAASNWFILVLWLAWLTYWLVSARNVKKDMSSLDWKRSARQRMLIVAVAVVALAVAGKFFGSPQKPAVPGNLLAAALGDAFVALGLGFSVWARVHLGRNWSNRPALKVGHELVISGPYVFVRHPIYTGVITAVWGSVLVAGGGPWLIIAIIFTYIFMRRIPVEERIMAETFPEKYPEYKKRTKALVPFIW